VIAGAFDDRYRAAVAYGKALTCHTPYEGFAACCTVQGGIANDDIFFSPEGAACRRNRDQAAAGEPFAKVVIGIAFQPERDAACQESAEALARAA
jgi:hypothetical protein